MRWHARALRGFTLIELMVGISLLAILLAIAVPSFKDASLGSQLRSSATDLMASVHLARSEAIKRNAVITLCASPTDSTTCNGTSWEQGWIILSGATVLQRQSAAPTGFKITASGGLTSLIFQPTGVGVTAASLTVCRATPTVGRQERVVTVDAAGRAWVRTIAAGICP